MKEMAEKKAKFSNYIEVLSEGFESEGLVENLKWIFK